MPLPKPKIQVSGTYPIHHFTSIQICMQSCIRIRDVYHDPHVSLYFTLKGCFLREQTIRLVCIALKLKCLLLHVQYNVLYQILASPPTFKRQYNNVSTFNEPHIIIIQIVHRSRKDIAKKSAALLHKNWKKKILTKLSNS